MKLIKKIKTRSFHSRFQVKWRRRREGKTNYYSRKKLLLQDKQKYNVAKYRLVVRFSKKNILCQLIYSRLEGDFVISSSYSRNLPNIGLPLINNNYSTSYINGLYLSKKFFSENFLDIKKKQPKNNFTVILDLGLVRVTTGNKVFAAMKGAVDGGFSIPHNEKRFPGFKKNEDFEVEVMKDRIEGKHVFEYMKLLKDEDEEKFSTQFKSLVNKNLNPIEYFEMNRNVIKNIVNKS